MATMKRRSFELVVEWNEDESGDIEEMADAMGAYLSEFMNELNFGVPYEFHSKVIKLEPTLESIRQSQTPSRSSNKEEPANCNHVWDDGATPICIKCGIFQGGRSWGKGWD